VIASPHARRKPLSSNALHLTSFLSTSSALFYAKDTSQLFWNQLLPHSFACDGGYTPSPTTSSASLTSHETLLRESRISKSLVFNALQTLQNSKSCKSFACHSYENCRVYTNNSHFGSPCLPRASRGALAAMGTRSSLPTSMASEVSRNGCNRVLLCGKLAALCGGAG
jgi:hypothetical protein